MSDGSHDGPHGYRTVDMRAVVRCTRCGSWLQANDKAAHTEFHRKIETLFTTTAQPVLPPF